jgi:hypothetical protein
MQMTQNAIQTMDSMALSSGQRLDQNVWQHRSANGEALWSWITWAFTAYWILFVAGAFLNRKELNAVGGVLVLGVLAWLLIERLWVRLDAIVMASLAAATFVPMMQTILSNPPTAESLFKHVSLCMVIAFSRLLQLPVVYKSKLRWVLAAQVLAIILISLTIFKGAAWDGGTRHSGLFVNPNNLALIPFLLLFFIDSVKDKWFVLLAAHIVVIIVLAFTGTSGADMAYVIGLGVHLASRASKNSRSIVYGIAAVSALAAVAFVAAGGERLLPETRFTNQISVMRGQLDTVLDGSDVAYYEQEKVLGPGSGSAIWRISHWRHAIITYSGGTPEQQIFGFGIGSTPRILGKLPHNEYLRLLFEQGIVGFLLFYFAWYRIVMTAPRDIRYVGLIIAIYSFSENNLDNFPFMALLILCLSARSVSAAVETKIKRPLVASWNESGQQEEPSSPENSFSETNI